MKGRMPLGPIDSALRQPLALDLELSGEIIEAARLNSGLSSRELEAGFKGVSVEEGLSLASRICARCSVAHSIAFCRAIEKSQKIELSESSKTMRAIIAEYERVASHLEVLSDVGLCLEDDMLFRGPRRYVRVVRDAFVEMCQNPFGFAAVVPGGLNPDGDYGAVMRLGYIQKPLGRDCGFWRNKLRLSAGRLNCGELSGDSIEEDAPPAFAFRGSGASDDLRAAERAYGYYQKLSYEPPARHNGRALDRVLLLLDETLSSLSMIVEASGSVDEADVAPPAIGYGKGSGTGVAESPAGALEHRVFLGSEGSIIRDRVTCAVETVARYVEGSLEGVRYQDAMPALLSFHLCAACIDR